MESVGGKVLGVTTRANYFLSELNVAQDGWRIALIVLDIFIVALVFYWAYIIVRETRGIRIIYGIVLLLGLTALGRYLELSAFNFILKYLSTMILVAIPVVLQPELRSALEKLGRTSIVADFTRLKRRDVENLLDTVVETATILSQNKIGALMVFTRQTGLREYIETGTLINGKVTTELLLTIFSPKTPLHDGAIIISGNRLVAAGCTLPLSDSKMNLSLGTRHRAALGMASLTDSVVLVVSEENGRISLALDGKLYQNLNDDSLRNYLSKELHEMRSLAQEKK